MLFLVPSALVTLRGRSIWKVGILCALTKLVSMQLTVHPESINAVADTLEVSLLSESKNIVTSNCCLLRLSESRGREKDDNDLIEISQMSEILYNGEKVSELELGIGCRT